MRAEQSPAFVTRVTVFAYARKDTAVLDVTSAFLDITAIPTVDRATAVLSVHPPSVAILRASVRASPISPEELAINAVQDITNIRSASVCESYRKSLHCTKEYQLRISLYSI